MITLEKLGQTEKSEVLHLFDLLADARELVAAARGELGCEHPLGHRLEGLVQAIDEASAHCEECGATVRPDQLAVGHRDVCVECAHLLQQLQ